MFWIHEPRAVFKNTRDLTLFWGFKVLKPVSFDPKTYIYRFIYFEGC